MGLIPRRRRHSSGSIAAAILWQQRESAKQTDGYWCAGGVLGRGRLVCLNGSPVGRYDQPSMRIIGLGAIKNGKLVSNERFN